MAYSVSNNENADETYGGGRVQRITAQIIGAIIFLAGCAFVVLLASYSPNDANWFAATGNPPENLLGSVGAAIAGTLILSVGWASWALAILLLAWGLRFILLRGNETAFTRLIFVPFLLLFGAAFMATHTPPEAWPHGFGLGGLLGDAALGLMFDYSPVDLRASLVLLGLGLATLSLLLLLVCTGVTFGEFRWFLTMSFWSLGTVFGFARKPFAGRTGKTEKPTKASRQSRREAKRLAKKMPPEVNSTETGSTAKAKPSRGGVDPFEARVNLGATTEPRLQAEPKQTGELISKVTRAKTGFSKSILKPKKPMGDDDKSKDAQEQPKLSSFLSPSRWTSKSQATKDASETSDSGADQGETLSAPESEVTTQAASVEPLSELTLEERLKQRISLAIQEREEPEDVKIEGQTEGSENVEVAFDDDAIDELDDDDRFDEDQDIEDAPSPRRGLFSRNGDNLFTSLGGDADNKSKRGLIKEPPLSSTGRPTAAPPVSAPNAIVEHPKPKKEAPSKQAQREAQPELFKEPKAQADAYEFPPLNLLATAVKIDRASLSDEALAENARMLETVLDDYGIKGEIVSVRPGPVVTMYELEPAPGLKASRVIGLSDDIARSMSALSARVSTVPGRTVIGIELPNEQRETVYLRELLSGRDYGDGKHMLPLALGKDIAGKSIVTDLAKMPHLLIAGTTGSGKSVAINTMILSLLYKLSPEDCRLIMIDPKMLELSVYDGIPHLLSPVVTDPKKAVVALKWVVGEMEERYRKMSKMGVRNIAGYNGRVQEALDKGEDFERTVQTGFDDATGDPVFETESFKPEKLPYIVVIVDEMADLMMVAGKEIEACIQRLAQMARASGIHLIMATQRPSVDVITGTIKANFPTRISFQVTSKVDSRTILGEMGAEQLLGMGDMLYMAGGGKITRVHGPFASDEEVEEVVQHLRAFGPPVYVNSVVEGTDDDKESQIDQVLGLGGNTGKEDALYDEAVAIVARDRKASTSYIQRRLSIGYNKAARLVEQMEENGVVSAANHVGKRDVLLPEQ
ncbi:MAG: DNA translocase FtsK 4TM domain-containing protein [Pseudomonadota bacterium]